jgi:hypothetical protein
MGNCPYNYPIGIFKFVTRFFLYKFISISRICEEFSKIANKRTYKVGGLDEAAVINENTKGE